MSKLFELYVLSLLKDRFGEQVDYHYYRYGNELDYLLDCDEYKMVIDAKYKTSYQNTIDNDDIRQVSGYARLDDVYKRFGKSTLEVIDCLIIYADQVHGLENLMRIDFKNDANRIEHYVHFYKIPIKLPVIN